MVKEKSGVYVDARSVGRCIFVWDEKGKLIGTLKLNQRSWEVSAARKGN